jgi:hypothetical protein
MADNAYQIKRIAKDNLAVCRSAHSTRIRPMRRPRPVGDFVLQNGPQDLQPGLPGEFFYPSLHLRPHVGH